MTRSATIFTMLWVLALSGACAANKAQSIVPSVVIATPPSRYGDLGMVSGYLRFDSHSRQLWDNAAALHKNNVVKCITLINTSPFEAALRRLDKSRVEIKGFAVEDVLADRIDFGACNKKGFYVKGVRPLADE